ncbi:uncharacterized protein NPIL_577491 [Nephila pilipes]|uniref:Uncharacterized protein n=1 Tax=Nephila pilipes TaxID=299642 RepID=A0A8X6PBX6_NEPPI|nr:uncharacterized protein NPIL_577491 [Nephila pilipes]
MALVHSTRSYESRRRRKFLKKAGRFVVVVLCMGGLLFQTMQFLLLYWTYPTVVDIQKSSPSYLEIPSITICNPIGYNYTAMCMEFGVSACLGQRLVRYAQNYLCIQHEGACIDGKLPKDFTGITFNKFLKDLGNLSFDLHEKLRESLESYAECTIEYAGITEKCNMDHVMGSFYTEDDLPQYCYTLYSLWGNPDKKRERIPKGSVMSFHFNLNASRRCCINEEFNAWLPKFNTPTSPSVQIAIHNPYFLPSPYLEGSMFQGGKSYHLRVMMEETHLLQSPYQTNCTDYLKTWKENGGKGPVNQMGIVQQCRANMYDELWGCVPLQVDYPHTYSICNSDFKNITVSIEDCMMLVDNYNQPCDSVSYETIKEEVEITLVKIVKSRFLPNIEELRTKIQGYDCSGVNIWSPECSTINIEILFDRFEITNLTYNPKFESLEMFSSLGGYMGMWLGISLVTVYDFLGTVLGVIKSWTMKKRRKRVISRKKDPLYTAVANNKLWQTQIFHNKIHNW